MISLAPMNLSPVQLSGPGSAHPHSVLGEGKQFRRTDGSGPHVRCHVLSGRLYALSHLPFPDWPESEEVPLSVFLFPLHFEELLRVCFPGRDVHVEERLASVGFDVNNREIR